MSHHAITDDQTTLDALDDTLQSLASPEELQDTDSHAITLFQNAGWVSVESYADQLMDELFEEVEGILDRNAPLANSSASKVNEELSPAPSSSNLTIPSMQISRQPSVDDIEPVSDHSLSIPSVEPEHQHTWGVGKSIDNVFLIAACGSVVATVLLWLSVQGRSPLGNPVVTVPPAPVASSQPPADAEFLEYMKRSLDVIDRKAETMRQLTAAANPASSDPQLPVVSVPGSAPSTTANSGAPERVYIPVYQPPVAGSTLPTTAAPATASNNPAAPDTPPASTTGTVPNIATATVTHRLVGVLASDDPAKSWALFEMNDTTQRISVGEAIGSSGWTLVSVRGDEAIVRRNGEVRSIYAGQQF